MSTVALARVAGSKAVEPASGVHRVSPKPISINLSVAGAERLAALLGAVGFAEGDELADVFDALDSATPKREIVFDDVFTFGEDGTIEVLT